jgi:hypothetical protein
MPAVNGQESLCLLQSLLHLLPVLKQSQSLSFLVLVLWGMLSP